MILPSKNRPGNPGLRAGPGVRKRRRRLGRARSVDQARSELLVNLSHEIRTALNAILGMTEAALDATLDDETRECLRIVRTAGESLLAIFNDVLEPDEIANIASGTLGDSATFIRPFTPPRLNILLVDDHPFNQKVGTYKLKKMGHEVWVASSGSEALSLLDSANFDLVFMDVQMKDLDGLEATRRVRQREQSSGRRTPIIAVSASVMNDDRQRCLDAGMDGFVSKPVRDDELLRAIQSVIDSEPETTRSAAAVKPIALTSPESRITPTFNLAKSRERVGGNLKLLDELIVTFREDCPALMAEIDTAVCQGNAPALCHSAHTLKSMLLFFEATDASQSALRLEQMGRNSDLAGAPDVFSHLSVAVDNVLQVFSEQGPSPP